MLSFHVTGEKTVEYTMILGTDISTETREYFCNCVPLPNNYAVIFIYYSCSYVRVRIVSLLMKLQVLQQIFLQYRPLVMDPANPTNNVCSKFEWKQIGDAAKEVLESRMLRDVSSISWNN